MIVTLEEHFTTTAFLKATEPWIPNAARSAALEQKLLDLGAGRIAAMDAGGVDLQVMSLAATEQEKLEAALATSLVRDANDELADAVARHPSRFAGFASLALKDPISAARELERGVQKLGFKGGFVNGTEGGSFLDDSRFYPLLEAAEALNVPIYLHPAPPPEVVAEAYFAGLPEASAYFLSTAAWGWHAEAGMHCLRLILSGVLDRFPGLQIIIGHMGENLPFSLARADGALPSRVTQLKRSVAEYFHSHFYVTTSGYFTAPPFDCALEVVGEDRLMYSVDYPYRENTEGQEFLRTISVSPSVYAKLTHENAQRLLRLSGGEK
jgi:predicted TIM-barrel fold metal-dependent hydrolase